ncbi:hypothetical protein [Salimicrobium salexigens]|uniref:hypothetical protein n=1 Tax=Salimicrobium salexigens TaxID=908941 RepID=UPI0013562F1E|nr:hypothetical protein [Salimicrobium salexigens]
MIFIVLVFIGGTFYIYNDGNNHQSTKRFIENNFINQKGEIKTYIKKEEYLTESIGLYMRFLLLTDQKEAFQQQAKKVEQISQGGFVQWKSQDGHSNASVDDLRIMRSLYEGAKEWDSEYKTIADEIKTFIKVHQIKNNLIVDFYDMKSQKASQDIRLSYIDAEALDYFDNQIKEVHVNLLEKVKQDVFFPEVYEIDSGNFNRQSEVNMIDQSLIALNSNLLEIQTESFFEFVEEEMLESGIVYGRYDRDTLESTVTYESPSVYAILTITYIENENLHDAQMFYDRMKELQTDDGGYKSSNSNAHFFDNVLPAIAEEKFLEHK